MVVQKSSPDKHRYVTLCHGFLVYLALTFLIMHILILLNRFYELLVLLELNFNCIFIELFIKEFKFFFKIRNIFVSKFDQSTTIYSILIYKFYLLTIIRYIWFYIIERHTTENDNPKFLFILCYHWLKNC